mgnify:FL=1
MWYSAEADDLADYFREIADAINDVQPGSDCCSVKKPKNAAQSK